MYLYKNIKLLRNSAGMSQDQLGDLLGISQTQVGKYEKGNGYPPIDKLEIMVRIFGVSYDQLIQEDLSKGDIKRVNTQEREDDKILIRSLMDRVKKLEGIIDELGNKEELKRAIADLGAAKKRQQ